MKIHIAPIFMKIGTWIADLWGGLEEGLKFILNNPLQNQFNE